MEKEYIEEITITNAAANCPGIDVSVVRDYMTGRTPEIKCKECKFKAAPLGNSTYCNKQKRIVYASGCNYGEPKPITNADRFRSMSDEELAKWINHMQAAAYDRGLLEDRIISYPNNYSTWLGWLRQEVDNAEDQPTP